MGIYGPDFYSDEELIAEIKGLAKARKELVAGGAISVIAGEQRRTEFVRPQLDDMNNDLKEMLYEARQRGLSIGGQPATAILVEIG